MEKSRCYYDARVKARRAFADSQVLYVTLQELKKGFIFLLKAAASRYEKASGAHDAAKEMVTLAEEGFAEKGGGAQFDQAWQEMLNHATNRVRNENKIGKFTLRESVNFSGERV